MVSGPASRPAAVSSLAQLEDQLDDLAGSSAPGEVLGRRDRGSNAASPSASVAGDQLGDPALGDAVGRGDLGLGAALDDDGGDDQPGFRHDRASNPRPGFLCLETWVSYVLNQHTAPATNVKSRANRSMDVSGLCSCLGCSVDVDGRFSALTLAVRLGMLQRARSTSPRFSRRRTDDSTATTTSTARREEQDGHHRPPGQHDPGIGRLASDQAQRERRHDRAGQQHAEQQAAHRGHEGRRQELTGCDSRRVPVAQPEHPGRRKRRGAARGGGRRVQDDDDVARPAHSDGDERDRASSPPASGSDRWSASHCARVSTFAPGGASACARRAGAPGRRPRPCSGLLSCCAASPGEPVRSARAVAAAVTTAVSAARSTNTVGPAGVPSGCSAGRAGTSPTGSRSIVTSPQRTDGRVPSSGRGPARAAHRGRRGWWPRWTRRPAP